MSRHARERSPSGVRNPPQTWKNRLFSLPGGLAVVGLVVVIWASWPDGDDQLETKAIDALKKGNLSVAEGWLRRLLRRRPHDETVLTTLADVAFRQGRPRECIEWLSRAAEESPRPAQALVEVGARAFGFHLLKLAEQQHRRAMTMEPELLASYSALVRLALVTQQSGMLRQTIAEADQQRVDLSGDPVLLWLWVVADRGRWESPDAENWLRQAVQNDPDNAIVTAALARLYAQSSQSEDAQKLWTTPRTDQPHGWPLRLVKAEWETQAGQFTAAAKTLSTLPTEADSDPRTWHIRAQIAVAEGDPAVALDFTAESLRLDPWMIEAAYLRGRLLDLRGRTDESQAQLVRAAKLDQCVQRTLQLLQQSAPDASDALAAAELAAELGFNRWADLVIRWVKLRSPNVTLSERLLTLRESPPLSVAEAKPSEQTALRLRFETRTRSPTPSPDAAPKLPLAELRFRDVTAAMNLEFQYDYGRAPQRWLMETLGGGVAALDYDRDGSLDLFFSQAGTLSIDKASVFQPCALFRNDSGTRFDNVTVPAAAGVTGYFHGCVAGDLNEDGFVDLVLCGYGHTALLWNQGDGTWTDGTVAAGMVNDRWTTSGTAVDLDHDGDLDIYQAAYCEAPLSAALRTCRDAGRFSPCRPNAYPPATDILWENRGDGHFVERTTAAGITGDTGYGLGTVAADFDNDGGADIFVGNDTTANFLWWNQGRGLSLSEAGLAAGVGVDGQGRAEACMGIACGDVDGNGFLDLFVTNFHDETATLYINHGNRSFEDQTETSGLSNAGRQLMGWGTQFVDLNADGWLDVVILNGHLHDMPQLPQIYVNQAGRFAEVSTTAGDFFRKPTLGRSLAVGDFDGDGRDDLAVSHQFAPATLLRNESEAGGTVRLQFTGTKSVRDATGTVVRAKVGQRELVRLVTRQGGYLSSCSSEIGLGLGDATHIDVLEITWPSGHVDRQENVPVGSRWLLLEAHPPMTIVP